MNELRKAVLYYLTHKSNQLELEESLVESLKETPLNGARLGYLTASINSESILASKNLERINENVEAIPHEINVIANLWVNTIVKDGKIIDLSTPFEKVQSNGR